MFLSKLNKTLFVSGGSFSMGNTSDEAEEKENHVHQVDVHDFYICPYLVTQALWLDVMGQNPSHFIGDDNPVENVSWLDCVEFCNKYSIRWGFSPCYQIDGEKVKLMNGGKGGFRLPTEEEWEFAARGGNLSRGFKYAGSNDVHEVAWCDSNEYDGTHPVGKKKPNELGLYDMSGNVWEWCWNQAGDDYFCTEQDAKYMNDRDTYRIIRGGSWSEEAYRCRVSTRGCDAPDLRCEFIGLRLVLNK